MTNLQEQRVCALAGTLQASSLVGRLARTGLIPQDSFETLVASLFIFDASHVADIYGGSKALIHGLRVLDDLLQGQKFAIHRETLRCALELHRLARQLQRETAILNRIRTGLEAIQVTADGSVAAEEDRSRKIASLYQDTISKLGHRIQVTGDVRYLKNSSNADKIRVLLMAGIRSAILWRQSGGRGWRLIADRKAMMGTVSRCLTTH